MIDIKKLSGVMNLDDREADILQHQHLHALNGRFYGGQNGMTFENIKGNDQIGFTLPDGLNEMIGGVFDQVHQRLIWFNFNDNRRHGIYMYSLLTGVVTPLLRCFINSQTDILNFQIDYPVSNPLILYTTESDGDVLFWTIRNQKPKNLNLKEAITNLYGANWLEEYLDVAKEPIFIPPVVAYEDDAANTVNNLRKKLFLFQPRYWYTAFEKSTYGSKSVIPVPVAYTDPQVDTDPTKNCRIAISIQTGDASVTRIEIIAFESLGNVFSKGFSVVILDKEELAIPDNSTYIYRFYNNEAYDFTDLNEQLLDFSRIPDTANDQALINGNTLAYGGITEGKDPVIPIVTMDVDVESPLGVTATTGFYATQYGLNGFQTDQPIKIVLEGQVKMGNTLTVRVAVGGLTFVITYVTLVNDTTLDALTGLSLSATGQGFAIVSLTDNELIIYLATQRLLNYQILGSNQEITALFTVNSTLNKITIPAGAPYLSLFSSGVQFLLQSLMGVYTVVSAVVVASDLEITVNSVTNNGVYLTVLTFINPVNNSIPVYNASSKENYGLVYFDKKGKTNGVTTSADFNVTTEPLNIQIVSGTFIVNTPVVIGRIGHRPPIWASYYQWVRSANLTKQSWLYWVSDRTYKDDKFAYISIESINSYKKINKNSVISYQFLPGDRIKFYVLYSPASLPIQSYGNEHDYEIVDEVINPDINGSTRIGQFVKIILPDVDVNFNFGTGLNLDYYFYYIELYTPAKSASEGLEVYYEFGQEYGIGNPGTTNAFHQGMVQNQSVNLATPALFRFDNGDAWYRTRNVNTGNTLLYDLVAGIAEIHTSISAPVSTLIAQHLQVEAYVTNDYQVNADLTSQPYTANYNYLGWTISMLGVNSYTFKVSGALNVSVLSGASSVGTPQIKVCIDVLTSAGAGVAYDLAPAQTVIPGATLTFDLAATIVIPPNSRTFLYFRSLNGLVNCRVNVISGFISYTEPLRIFEVGVIDQNFSDFFPSKVNSNGRPWVVNPDEKTTFFNTLIRFGGQYQQNTNINQINIFYPNDFVEAYRSAGDIQRMVVRDTQLIIFQERRVGYFGIYAKYIQTSDNDTQITTTNEVLTKTNIQYYQGEFGLGKQYTGVAVSKNVIYFIDPVRGYQLRLAGDGITPISELYKGQYTLRSLWIPYNGTITRPNGGSSKIIQFYDTRNEEVVCILQGGDAPKGVVLAPYTFSFNEMRNGYSSFFSYFPEWAICAQDVIYSWKEGKLYVHDSDTYCNFYGIQYDCSITIVCNLNLIEKKTWESIMELSNAIWACSEIYSNVMSYGTTRQQTMLGEYDFANLENNFHAAILRDQNSIGGIINGETMKGNYLVVKLIKQNASDLIYLTEVSIKWIDSPLTNK